MTASGARPIRSTASSTYFRSRLMRRNPKAEGRKKAEIRGPKAEGGEPGGESYRLAKTDGTCDSLPIITVRTRYEGGLSVQGGISDFGLRPFFDIRSSVFGFHGFPPAAPRHHTFVVPRRKILSCANAGLAWKPSPISVRNNSLNCRAASTTTAVPFWLNR